MSDRLQIARANGHLRSLDVHVGWMLARWASVTADEALDVASAGALVSAAEGEQHTCVMIDEVEVPWWPDLDADRVRQLLEERRVAGKLADGFPLVLEEGRLYLARVAHREAQLAERLRSLAAERVDGTEARRALLRRLFPDDPEPAVGDEIDWQRVAAAMAPGRRLTVVAGGPGTGKTTTVTALLAVLLDASPRALRIRLAAPTGKAAARLTEAVRGARERVKSLWEVPLLADELLDQIPAEATTLHRLLDYRPDTNTFGRDAANPMAADVVVVDECSMIDLRMAWQLVDALGPGTRLILVGDHDQLASVEAGSVFADLCSGLAGRVEGPLAGARFTRERARELGRLTGFRLGALGSNRTPPLADAVCWLRRRYRFGEQTGIAEVAAAINEGTPAAVVDAISAAPQVTLSSGIDGDLEERILGHFMGLHEAAVGGADPAELLDTLSGLQVLCALRRGPRGVETLNQRIGALLATRIGLDAGRDTAFPGQPVMVLGNDHATGLFNGDVGIWVAGGVAFRRPDGRVRVEPAARLPPFEPVFAMTIHKSQGSEFNGVVLLLPDDPGDNEARILTRELLYTGLTRARGWAHLVANAAVLTATASRRTRRFGQLAARLWESGQTA